jgi:guanylate kinase
MKAKPLIICIVGESCSGKSFLADILEYGHGISMIASRTTRERRSEWEDGHIFVTDEEFDGYQRKDMLAYTQWPDATNVDKTVRYCCLKGDVYDKVMSYVIDEYGLQYLKENWSDKYTIFSVRLFASESDRIAVGGAERVARDEGKFNLSEKYFDYFIDNDYTEAFEQKAEALIKYIKNAIKG